MILSVLEHQKIYIGKARNISKRQISFSDADAIRTIDINNKGIFKWGNRYIVPQQWVGVVSLPGLSLEILPKISDSYDEVFIKETLLMMFKVANDIPTRKNIKAKVNFTKNGLVEILISNYLDQIEFYIREGLWNSYCKVTKNLTAVKGSIDFAKQINKNIINPTRFVCKYSKLDIDNDVNRIIKYTMCEMKKISRDSINLRKLKTFSLHFEEVSDINSQVANNMKIKINRINIRVKEIIEYGKLFLDGYSVSISNGDNYISSMLFDMNKIFEKFIYKNYKKIFGSNVFYQSGNNYLITDKVGKIKKVKLKPDMLINTSKGFKMVVDTKWKIIKSFAKESDVYQMNAYVSSIAKTDIAVLMYPKTIETDIAVGDYNFLNSAGTKELKIRTVDLSIANDEIRFKNHLWDLLT